MATSEVLSVRQVNRLVQEWDVNRDGANYCFKYSMESEEKFTDLMMWLINYVGVHYLCFNHYGKGFVQLKRHQPLKRLWETGKFLELKPGGFAGKRSTEKARDCWMAPIIDFEYGLIVTRDIVHGDYKDYRTRRPTPGTLGVVEAKKMKDVHDQSDDECQKVATEFLRHEFDQMVAEAIAEDARVVAQMRRSETV